MNNHPIEEHEEHWTDRLKRGESVKLVILHQEGDGFYEFHPRPLTFLRFWWAIVVLIGIGLVIAGWWA